ncbi:hypothetical protein SUDANB51_00642 [Streptomyces sp. enrichment culture]
MRHPPPSLLSAAAGADALVATAVVPMVLAQGALRPRPREHTVGDQRDTGFHGSARSTEKSAASHHRTRRPALTDSQKPTRDRNTV